jgi:hypothetical protein
MIISEIFESTTPPLAKPEIMAWMNSKVIVNPTPGMLSKLLADDPHNQVRVLALGDDIAVCPSSRLIHQDIGSALAKNAHPAWANRPMFWYAGDGCWFIDGSNGQTKVTTTHGGQRNIPEDEWPLALKKALK